MTLQNGAIIGKRAFLWSDTAYSSLDGAALLGYGGKVFRGFDWPFAVSWTTVGRDPHWIAEQIDSVDPQSVPALLAACRDALIGFCASPGSSARLLVAVYDRATGKPRLFMIASEPMWDYPAFAPIEGISFVSSHNDSAAHQSALASGFTIDRMLNVIDTQYATPFQTVLGRPANIGGECYQVEVSKRGVTSQAVRNWMKDAA